MARRKRKEKTTAIQTTGKRTYLQQLSEERGLGLSFGGGGYEDGLYYDG